MAHLDPFNGPRISYPTIKSEIRIIYPGSYSDDQTHVRKFKHVDLFFE